MSAQHFAKPLVNMEDRGKPGIHAQYVTPFVCAVCGRPIKHHGRGGGAWSHLPEPEEES